MPQDPCSEIAELKQKILVTYDNPIEAGKIQDKIDELEKANTSCRETNDKAVASEEARDYIFNGGRRGKKSRRNSKKRKTLRKKSTRRKTRRYKYYFF
uniref:Uncharacterized protein n=1 Tax=viral metagenome TaxID=1070528 RepID=A0A6C0D5M4_9ZZZZ